MRKWFVVLCCAFLAAACSAKSSGNDGDNKSEPLRIAVVTSLSGTFAAVGEEVVQSVELAVDQINAEGGIDGRKVEVVKLETDGTPAQSLKRVDEAVGQDAPFITGLVTSAEALAAMPRVEARGGLLLTALNKADEIREKCSRSTFMFEVPNSMTINTIGSQVGNWGAKSWSILGSDYVVGHAVADGFVEQAKAAGLKTSKTIYVPIGTTEFGAQIAKLQQEKNDGLYLAAVSGSDALAFVKQANQFGLLQKYQATAGMNALIEPSFGALDHSVEGFRGNISYHHSIDNPQNKAFVDAWHAKYGADKNPSYIGGNTYLALQGLFKAVADAESVDPRKVQESLSTLDLKDSILGPVKMRSEDNVLQRPEYVGELVPSGAHVDWKVTGTVTAAEALPPAHCGS